MKTFLKIAGFVVLGVVVIGILGLVLGMIGTILKLLIPLAILGGIGFVAWKVLAGSGAPAAQETQATKKPDALPEGKSQEAAPQKKAGLSEEEARRVFEQMRRPDQK